MKASKPRAGRNTGASAAEPKPARCKAMFAELSDYFDEQLDDSLCEELERHLDGCGLCKVFLANLEATIERCRKSPAAIPSGPALLSSQIILVATENIYWKKARLNASCR